MIQYNDACILIIINFLYNLWKQIESHQIIGDIFPIFLYLDDLNKKKIVCLEKGKNIRIRESIPYI